MAWETLDKDRLEQILCQITGDKVDPLKDLVLPAMIKGHGVIFLWSPIKKSLVNVQRGTTIYIISYEMDEKDRILAYDGLNMLAIHPDDIEEIGFN